MSEFEEPCRTMPEMWTPAYNDEGLNSSVGRLGCFVSKNR